MSSRRSHTKSRNGCVQCKSRRIKCDERSPQCSNCQRREIVCDYVPSSTSRRRQSSALSSPTPNLSPSVAPSSAAAAAAAAATAASAPASAPLFTPFGGLDVLDLELLHHYTTSTYATLPSGAASDQHHHLWQTQVVQLGFHHEFLLRGILAVAALHLAYLGPPRRDTLTLRASAHQSVAVRLFYEALNSVDPSNCTAIFAFSCVIVALTFATPKSLATADNNRSPSPRASTSSPTATTSPPPPPSAGVQKELLDWFYMVRGCNSVLQTQWATLSQSFLAPLLKRGMMHETAASREVRDTAHVTELLRLCSAGHNGGNLSQDRDAANACALAVHELLNAFTQVSILTERKQDFVPVIFVWPIAIPQSYLGLLGERRPEAMVILAHYAALLQRVDDQWYMKGCGRYLVRQIDSALSPEWQSWLSWPKQVTGIDAAG